MNTLLNALYELLSAINENCTVWLPTKLPQELRDAMKRLQDLLGTYLSDMER